MHMKNTSRKTQSFLHGSLILIIATALVKIIGAIYKIPLYNILDNTGVGYYTTVYDLYTPMYTIAMAGLPIAISRLVAEQVSLASYREAKHIFKIAKRAMWVTGGIGFLLMMALAVPYAIYKGTDELIPCVFCIAPCLLFCCVMSSYRGYYEGLRNMTPTAVSEVIEALGKLAFGLVLAVAIKKLTGNMTYAVCGALLGITLGTAVSALYLVIKYKRTSRSDFTDEQLTLSPAEQSGKQALRVIVAMALPIVLGSLVTQVTTLIDNLMITARLSAAIKTDGAYIAEMYKTLIGEETKAYLADGKVFNMANDLPMILYGSHRGLAFSIYNLVPVITSVLGVSAIPVLTSAWTVKDRDELKSSMETILRTTAAVSMPAAFGLIALGRQVVLLLYSSKGASAETAGINLCILGVCALFAGLTAPTTSMLQAIGKQKIPLYNIAVGAGIKIIINFVLVGTPAVNIIGVPIGTTACYAYICIMNIIALVKHSGVKPDFIGCILKPFLAGLACGVSAFVSALLLDKFSHFGNSIITVVSIVFAVVIYLIFVGFMKIIKKNDIISLPSGEKIAKVLEKLHVIG